jgi:hypothetical protein
MAGNFVNSSTIGVNLQGNSDGATALFGLGQHVLGNASSEWIYVNAGVALTTGQMVSITTSFTATPTSLANVVNPLVAGTTQLAFVQGAFTALDYGWVALRGDSLTVLLSTTSTLGAPLYVGGSNGGALQTNTMNSGTMAGISLVTASATGTITAANVAFIVWPRANAAAIAGAL